jgi:ankyrin repeat protein
VLSGSLDTFKQQIPTADGGSNQWLEKRNHEGKTPLMLAAEHKHSEIFTYIVEEYPSVDINKVDSRLGNTVLHHLAQNGQV